jgi:flagellar basal body-associated protein FliL
MSKGVAKIKAAVQGVGEKARAVLPAIIAVFKRKKTGGEEHQDFGQPSRRAKSDPLKVKIKTFLWILLIFVWGGMAKLSIEIFAPQNFNGKGGAESKTSHGKDEAIYPWANGYSRGHDIVEPEVQEDRGLAAAIDSRELKVTVGARYIEFRDIEAVVKTGMGNHSRILVSITLEVDSYPAEQEVLAKEMQIREIVASILATKDKGVLQSLRGVVEFKNELLKRLKLVIRSREVTDVLITT